MAWKLQEGCEELVLAQPCSLAGPGAGHARSEAASTARLGAASRAFIRAVWPCPALRVASLWALWRPSVHAGRARASNLCSSGCV